MTLRWLAAKHWAAEALQASSHGRHSSLGMLLPMHVAAPTPQVFYIGSLGIFIVSLDCTYYRSGPKTNEASGAGREV